MTAAAPAVAPRPIAEQDIAFTRRRRFPRSLQLVLLGLLAFGFGVSTLDTFPIGAGADDAMYLVLAKSLATGQGYRSINLPGAPPNTHFPPGYPAVLSVLWRLAPDFPQNVILFKTFNIVCFVVAAVALSRLVARERVGRTWANAAGILAAISVPSLVLVALVFSEPLFICLVLLLLPSIERLARPRGDANGSVAHAAAIGVTIGLCSLVRTHGFVLVPALALVLAHQRRWRDLTAVVVGFLICLVPWQLWSAHYGGTLPTPLLGEYDSYTKWWMRGFREMGPGMVTRTLSRTMQEAGGMFAALFSPSRGVIPHAVTFIALVVLAAAGVAATWRRMPITLLFLAGYLTIVAVWPFQPSRFIWGVWPLILMLFVLGAHGAVSGRWPVAVRTLVAVAALWSLVGYGAYEVRAVRGQWWASIPRGAAPHIRFAVQWANTRTAPGDVIATEDEGPVFLYTGRRTVPVRPLTPQQYLEDVTPAQDAATGLLPLMSAYPVRTVIVYSRDVYLTAMHLSSLPRPRLTPLATGPGGAAFAVTAP